MKEKLLISALLILLIVPQAHSLFSNITTNNFSISGTSLPVQYVVLEGTASKFIAWNDRGQVTMSSINGSSLCKANFTQDIGYVIWPARYNPIVLLDDGSAFMVFNQSTCKPQLSFSMDKVSNVSGEAAQFITFKWINNAPVVAASGVLAVYEVDLSKPALINVYTPQDPSLPVNLVTTYSSDAKLIYVTMVDRKTAASTVRVWNTSVKVGNFTKAIPYNLTFVLDLKPSRDNSSIISVGVTSDNTTKIHTFDYSGTITQKASRPKVVPSLTISDTNMFDSVAFFDAQQKSFEVIKLEDGKSMQNISFSDAKGIAAIDYQSRVMIIVDNSSRVITYTYKDDQSPSPDPKPDPDPRPDPTPTPDNDDMPLWGYIVIGVCGLIVVSVVVVMVCRRTRNGKNSGVYRNFSDEV